MYVYIYICTYRQGLRGKFGFSMIQLISKTNPVHLSATHRRV